MKQIVLIGLLFVAGCTDSDPNLAPATGMIRYRGQPIADAKVTFQPENGVPAIGQTDTDGKFELKTRGQKGVAIGPTKVAVVAVTAVGTPPRESEIEIEMVAQTNSRIPEKYGSLATSGLSATVQRDGENQFTFDLID